MGLRGRAGTGKTTLMKEVAASVRAGGKEFHAFAPTAEAARSLLREEGFAGAETVAKLLSHPKMQESIKGQVIWIDEAGLLGTPTLRSVFHLAEKQGARVILTGDPGQHGAVQRGDAFRLLITSGALPCPDVKDVRRQRATLRGSSPSRSPSCDGSESASSRLSSERATAKRDGTRTSSRPPQRSHTGSGVSLARSVRTCTRRRQGAQRYS